MSDEILKESKDNSRAIATINKRYFDKYHYSPESVTETLDRLERQRFQIIKEAISHAQRVRAGQITAEQQQIDVCVPTDERLETENLRREFALRAAGVNVDALRIKLDRVESTRRAVLLAMPPHVPLLQRPSDPTPPVTSLLPVAKWDRVDSSHLGAFDSIDESPLTNEVTGVIGSKFKASALSGALGDVGQIQHSRESGLLLNYSMSGPPAKLYIQFTLRLHFAWHSAIFFDKSPGPVYCSIYEYHLPFVTIHFAGSSPIFTPVFSRSYPGLHGVEWFRSRFVEGGPTQVKNPTPAEEHWDFNPVTFSMVTHDVIDPVSNPDGVCIVIGVRHMVQALVDFTRFEVESIGQWGVESIGVGTA